MDIFTNFKIKKGMTLEKFESENRETYAQYEQFVTEVYNKQEEKVQKWLKQEQSFMKEHQEHKLEALDRLEMELEKEKEELLSKLELQRDAESAGVKIPKEELLNLPYRELVNKYFSYSKTIVTQ